MSLVSVLIPVTLVLVGFAVWGFFWAVRTEQFDELDAPAWEILVEERIVERAPPPQDPAALPPDRAVPPDDAA